MKVELKTWTTLGLAGVLAGAGLSGCAGESGEGGEAAQSSQEGEAGAGEGGEGEGGEGEGGEGEGGVAISEAGSDPVVYGSALAIVAAHAIAANEAYAAGETKAASSMFGHPVAEVLADMEPVFKELGVADFKSTMSDASAAASKPDNAKGVEAAYKAIMAALDSAAEKAPTSELSQGAIAAGIVADQIDRATGMYGEARKSDAYEPYLDGYGFYKAAERAFQRDAKAIESADPELAKEIKATLALLKVAYPGVKRPGELSADQGELLAAASKIKLALPAG